MKVVTAVLPQGNANRIESDLISAKPQEVAAVLAQSVAGAYLKHPVRLLPAGSTLRIDAAAMTVSGTLASVPATVSGAHPGKWTLLLVKEGAQWLVYATRAGS